MKTKIVKANHILAFLVLLVVLLAAASCALPGTVASSVPSLTSASPPAVAAPTPISPSPVLFDSETALPFPDFISVIANVSPSVVAITTEVSGYNIFGSSYTQEGADSGWIIDGAGLIVTNTHFVS
jgi:S1-C subfamily serine protease